MLRLGLAGTRAVASARALQGLQRAAVPVKPGCTTVFTRPARRPLATTTLAPPPASASASASASAHSHDNTNLRPLAYWLLGTGALVAGMVTVGGITRLTKSGLSMTDWRLQGSLPPMTDAEWAAEFARYQQFPEYQQRRGMSLEEFKFIFWWEYGHRMMGRVIGLAYALPLGYFAARGRIPRAMYPRLATLFALGGTQGLVGWWMVKSGLEMDPQQRKEIRVSPYRLATHLGFAFTTFSLLVWTGLDCLHPREQAARLAAQLQAARPSPALLQQLGRVRGAGLASAALLGTTILSGAFVAGNDAGRAYNTFPKMGDDWLPEGLLELEPAYRNFFENTATVQLDHRVLALSTAGAIAATLALARRGQVWAALPPQSRTALAATAGMAGAQVALGITTLLLYVPVPLAAAHQAGSLVLLSLLTYSVHSLRFLRLVAPAAGAVTGGGGGTAMGAAAAVAAGVGAAGAKMAAGAAGRGAAAAPTAAGGGGRGIAGAAAARKL